MGTFSNSWADTADASMDLVYGEAVTWYGGSSNASPVAVTALVDRDAYMEFDDEGGERINYRCRCSVRLADLGFAGHGRPNGRPRGYSRDTGQAKRRSGGLLLSGRCGATAGWFVRLNAKPPKR